MRPTCAGLGECQAALCARLDYPETHLEIAGAALTTRKPAGGRERFSRGRPHGPQGTDARVMLVRIAAATEGDDAARAALDAALDASPRHPDLMASRQAVAAGR